MSQQDIERMLEKSRKAVEETIQKQFAFQQRETVALSDLSAGHFERIRQYVRMTVEPVEWSAILPSAPSTTSTSSTSVIPAFQWSDENENQQQERYLSYLRSNLSVPRHLSVERAPVSLLDTFKSRYLPFDVRGTSDVMVVERASGITPVFGIRMLLELKKQRPGAKDVYQTMGELLAADQHTPFSPIVVLTNLADYWRFCWLEGRQLRFCEAPSRSAHPSQRSAQAVSSHLHLSRTHTSLSLCVLIVLIVPSLMTLCSRTERQRFERSKLLLTSATSRSLQLPRLHSAREGN